MRIENRPIGSKDKLEKGKTAPKAGGSFLETLKEMEDKPELDLSGDAVTSDDVRNLAGLIEQMGENMSRNPTPEAFASYKKHIKLMVKLLQDNVEIIDTTSRLSLKKGTKLYKTIQTIDDNLAQIAGLIMNGVKNRLDYLNLVNNIKGLIIDLIY